MQCEEGSQPDGSPAAALEEAGANGNTKEDHGLGVLLDAGEGTVAALRRTIGATEKKMQAELKATHEKMEAELKASREAMAADERI